MTTSKKINFDQLKAYTGSKKRANSAWQATKNPIPYLEYLLDFNYQTCPKNCLKKTDVFITSELRQILVWLYNRHLKYTRLDELEKIEDWITQTEHQDRWVVTQHLKTSFDEERIPVAASWRYANQRCADYTNCELPSPQGVRLQVSIT